MINVLVTGGAGFIGSNLVEHFLADDRIGLVRVLDNFITGHTANLKPFADHPQFELIEGDIRDVETCMQATEGIDLISHQAALGSVPRSIENPRRTNEINIAGTLNIFVAAQERGIKRVVYAASSSTYGDSTSLPKVEHEIGQPISPYAVTKLVNELYADVFNKVYGLETIGLRYFNVFGPNQDPNGPYAAVIPLFIKAVLAGQSPTIFGDGTNTRDFTYVDNVLQANTRAMFTTNPGAINQVYNVACGEQTSLTGLFDIVLAVEDKDIEVTFGPARVGDVQHSLADISKAKQLLGYDPQVTVQEGIQRAYTWYKNALLQSVEM